MIPREQVIESARLSGLIAPQSYTGALTQAKHTQKPIVAVLDDVRRGESKPSLTERELEGLIADVADAHGMARVQLAALSIDAEVAALTPQALRESQSAIAFHDAPLRVALWNPLDTMTLAALLDLGAELHICTRAEITLSYQKLIPTQRTDLKLPTLSERNREMLERLKAAHLLQDADLHELELELTERLEAKLIAAKKLPEHKVRNLIARTHQIEFLEHLPAETLGNASVLSKSEAQQWLTVIGRRSSSGLTAYTLDPQSLPAISAQLGETPSDVKLLTAAHFARLLERTYAPRRAMPLHQAYVHLGYYSEAQVQPYRIDSAGGQRELEDALQPSPEWRAQARAHAYALDFREPDESEFDRELLETVKSMVTSATLDTHTLLPWKKEGDALHLLTCEPGNHEVFRSIAKRTQLSVVRVVARRDYIERMQDALYRKKDRIGALTQTTDTEERAEEEQDLSNPTAQLVQHLIKMALINRASDIHIEPRLGGFRIRFRVDGDLMVYTENDADARNRQVRAIISHLKNRAKMDIGERRLPQDGRFTFTDGELRADLRVSTLPIQTGDSLGEKMVMRLLSNASDVPTLEGLDLLPDNLRVMQALLKLPNGLILVTGPTGSGKSRTLYSALKQLNEPHRNITTVEDPVEILLPGMNQAPVNEHIGRGFSSLLRAILRQDPDIIFVGEIRDADTAQIAFAAALTGHLVLGSLHTNDAPSSIARLEELGIERSMIVAGLRAVLAQRLAKRPCSNCSAPHPIGKSMATTLELPRIALEMQRQQLRPQAQEIIGTGCARCNKTGYQGRIALHELMHLDDALRTAILEKASRDHLEALALERGMIRLRDDGLSKVLLGKSRIEQVLALSHNA